MSIISRRLLDLFPILQEPATRLRGNAIATVLWTAEHATVVGAVTAQRMVRKHVTAAQVTVTATVITAIPTVQLWHLIAVTA